MDKPRTFLLDPYSGRFKPSIAMDKQVMVVEVEPVLNLLEECHRMIQPGSPPKEELRGKLYSILSDHGRLR